MPLVPRGKWVTDCLTPGFKTLVQPFPVLITERMVICHIYNPWFNLIMFLIITGNCKRMAICHICGGNE
jgi:hypothetical protein